MHANCMNLAPAALLCLTAALSAVYWGFGVILSPAVTHNDDRRACWPEETPPQVGGLLTDPVCQTWRVSSHARWVISVLWGGLGRDMRTDSFLSLIQKTSFLLHSPAGSSIKLFLVQYCPHMDLTGKNTSKYVHVPLHWWGLLMRIFEEKFEAI